MILTADTAKSLNIFKLIQFYNICNLIKEFSTLTNKKETIPVYFNFGLIATIGVSFPIVLYVVLNDSLELYLMNYIVTSIALLTIGIFMFRSLILGFYYFLRTLD